MFPDLKKQVLFLSPDLSLCASLLMFFYDKYAVTTTTNFKNAQDILSVSDYDLIVLDAEPDENIGKLCATLSTNGTKEIPIIMTYVYSNRYKAAESEIRKYVDAIFYKPIDILEVSRKIDSLLQPVM